MSIDIKFIEKNFFYFDKPVPYKLKEKNIVYINPINVESSEIFLFSVGILNIDKNSSSDIKVIQMSYLQYLYEYLLKDIFNRQKFINILLLCMGLKFPEILIDEKGKPFIHDKKTGITINYKEFDDIRKIILYQNILHYDDSYINPELKQAFAEVDELRNKNFVAPNIERKMAIITAHTGVTKKQQLEMTYRSHCLLFEEVCGEVEFITVRPIAVYAGKDKEFEHWIYKKTKNKFDKYITDIDTYSQSMGGKQTIRPTEGNLSENYVNQFNNFIKK